MMMMMIIIRTILTMVMQLLLPLAITVADMIITVVVLLLLPIFILRYLSFYVLFKGLMWQLLLQLHARALRWLNPTIFWLSQGGIDRAPKGDIDIDVDAGVDEDIDSYLGHMKGGWRSVQVLLNGIETIVVSTLLLLK